MKTSQFYNSNGTLTAYSFACGYVEKVDTDLLHKELYREHNCFHVRSLRNNSPQLASKFDGPTSHLFVIWETFETLTNARKFYNSIK